MAEHLKTSVESHLQMTKRWIKEIENGVEEKEAQLQNKLDKMNSLMGWVLITSYLWSPDVTIIPCVLALQL